MADKAQIVVHQMTTRQPNHLRFNKNDWRENLRGARRLPREAIGRRDSQTLRVKFFCFGGTNGLTSTQIIFDELCRTEMGSEIVSSVGEPTCGPGPDSFHLCHSDGCNAKTVR